MKNKVQLITYADRLGDGTLKSMTDTPGHSYPGFRSGSYEEYGEWALQSV